MAVNRSASIVVPGLLLGIGLGGFVDGIVLHQILQWHHLLSTDGRHPTDTVAGLEVNTLADGLFHLFAFAAVSAAVFLLWGRRGEPLSRLGLFGLTLAGWGLFNIVEGLVNHQILGIHHVRPGPDQAAYDIGFLVLGTLLVAGGAAIYRATGPARRATDRPAVSTDSSH